MDLKNKVALVTGGAKGIGLSIVESLVNLGCYVIVNYNTSEKEAIKLKDKAMIIKADISNELEVKEMFNKIIDKYKKIDILINNAAYTCDNLIEDKNKNEFMRVLEVNVFGTFYVTKCALKYMDKGIIINISSTDSIDTYNEYNIDYSASKAAINSLTKTFALINKNNKIISLMPLWVSTESVREMDESFLKQELIRTNQSRLLEPNEVALKVIELINSSVESGSIIRMEE